MDVKNAIKCPLHSSETVSRVCIELGAPQELYCIECLLSLSGNFNKSQIISIGDFLERAGNHYEKNRKRVSGGASIPSSFQEVLETKDEGMSKVFEQIETEKKRVNREFDDIEAFLHDFINKKRAEAISKLEKEIIVYQGNFAFFEKQVNKAFPTDSDIDLYPNMETLAERFNKIQNATQLIGFVRNIKQDLNEATLMSGLEGDDEMKRIVYLKSLSEGIHENKKIYPSMLDADYEPTSFKSDLTKILNEKIDKFFRISNSYLDLSTNAAGWPKSDLLKVEDFKLIQGWLPEKYRGKKWKLLYSYAKNEKNANALIKEIKGYTPTLILYRSTAYAKVFGGFMDKDWTTVTSGQYFQCPEAFLFSVNKKEKYPVKAGQNAGYYDVTSYGPCFGNDLYVTANNGGGYMGCSGYTTFDYTSVAGNSSFTVDASEIYALV